MHLHCLFWDYIALFAFHLLILSFGHNRMRAEFGAITINRLIKLKQGEMRIKAGFFF